MNKIDKLADILLSARFEEFYNNFIKSGEYNEKDMDLRSEIAILFWSLLEND